MTGDGLIVDALVGEQYGLAFGADGALAAVHEVDGAAVDLSLTLPVSTPLASISHTRSCGRGGAVPLVAHLTAGAQVVGIDGHLGGVAQQVSGEAGGWHQHPGRCAVR